jgi:hypothetical protein
MDTNIDKNQYKGFAVGTPTSAFTRYVRDPPNDQVIRAQKDRMKRKSAFARIKQLFSLQSPDTATT